MLSIILILLLVFVALGLLLAATTLSFQNYLYNEPANALYWRAPAGAAALTLFLSIWVVLDYNSIHDRDDSEGRYQSGYSFTLPYETITYEHLWVTTQNRGEEHFVRRGTSYLGPNGRRFPTRPLQIAASHTTDGEKHIFKPPLDANGHFKAGKNERLRYYEEGNTKKHFMDEHNPGQISIFHFGWLFVAILLHIGLFLMWFLSLWLLLGFQWPHALSVGLGFWFVSLFIIPMILRPIENVRRERLPPKTTTAFHSRGAASYSNS